MKEAVWTCLLRSSCTILGRGIIFSTSNCNKLYTNQFNQTDIEYIELTIGPHSFCWRLYGFKKYRFRSGS